MNNPKRFHIRQRIKGIDLYDAVTETVIKSNVSGETEVDIEANQSVIIVEIPTNSTLVKTNNQTKIEDIVISSSQATLNILNYDNNAEVNKSFTLKVDTVLSNPLDEVLYYEVEIDGQITTYDNGELKISSTSGSKTLIVHVYTKNGLYDYKALRIRVK